MLSSYITVGECMMIYFKIYKLEELRRYFLEFISVLKALLLFFSTIKQISLYYFQNVNVKLASLACAFHHKQTQ